MRRTNGHDLELVADGFSFPTSLTFDSDGLPYVAESGLALDNAQLGGRVWQLGRRGARRLLAERLRAPVNGLIWHEETLFVSEGGHPARISRLDLAGRQTPIVENLPGPGNYHLNTVAIGPDRKVYFSQGAMTNSGVVGLDAYDLAWLRRLPHAWDVPGHDVELAGVNFETADPISTHKDPRALTGAFVPFGTRTERGQRIAAQLPCTAAVMRCDLDGTNLDLVAWGIRNAYGLGFLPDGRLLATDQGADDRGSRPVGDAPDLLIEVRPGTWYGWPDFVGSDPITNAEHRPKGGPALEFVLSNHAALPPLEKPLLCFPPHAGALKFDFLPEVAPRWGGHILVALFGDEKPMTASRGPREGRFIARVDPADWSLHPVLKGPLQRPIDVKFNAKDDSLYVLDFGFYEMSSPMQVHAKAGSGSLWRLRLN